MVSISQINDDNSTNVNLGNGAIFTGIAVDVQKFASIIITVISDQTSASNGLRIQFSPDNSLWVTFHSFAYTANEHMTQSIGIKFRYFRIVFTNGSIPTTSLNIQSILSEEGAVVSSESQEIMFSTEQADAFGRIKVSNPQRILDLTHTRGLNENLETVSIINSGGLPSQDWKEDESAVDMTITGLGSITRQSRVYSIYQPGKSLTIYLTGVLDSDNNTSTLTSRMGYFDNNNGIFLEYDGTNISVVLRSYITGAAVDNKILQSDWNIDTFDGSGPSGLNLDISSAQIFVIDLEWLGVGIVRTGLVIRGTVNFAHFFFNSNLNSTTYMTTANLPVRYQLIGNDGLASGRLKQICASVQSDGGYDPKGIIFSENRGILSINATTTITPLISIRLKVDTTSHARTNVLLDSITAITPSNANALIELWITRHEFGNPLTASTFSLSSADSSVEVDTRATAFSSRHSRRLQSTYVSNNNNETQLVAQGLTGLSVDMGQSISDIITLTARVISGNQAYLGGFNWTEVY